MTTRLAPEEFFKGKDPTLVYLTKQLRKQIEEHCSDAVVYCNSGGSSDKGDLCFEKVFSSEAKNKKFVSIDICANARHISVKFNKGIFENPLKTSLAHRFVCGRAVINLSDPNDIPEAIELIKIGYDKAHI